MLTDSQNDRLNRINFGLEILLTVSIFVSSFLVLTLEKDFWTDSETTRQKQMESFANFMRHGKGMTKKNPVSVLGVLRLMLIGSSISFFMAMSFLEIVSNML